jgi:serralysin
MRGVDVRRKVANQRLPGRPAPRAAPGIFASNSDQAFLGFVANLHASANGDRIIDGLSGLAITLTGVDVKNALTGNGGDTAAFSGTAGELRQAASGDNTIVSGDVDGNGVGDFLILLIGSLALNQTDFAL